MGKFSFRGMALDLIMDILGAITDLPLTALLFYCQVNSKRDNVTSLRQAYLTTKLRKKGAPRSQVKNKDQVRHFYYRTWHKISKYITFNEGQSVILEQFSVAL